MKKNKKLICCIVGHNWEYLPTPHKQSPYSNIPVRRCLRCGQTEVKTIMKTTQEIWVKVKDAPIDKLLK